MSCPECDRIGVCFDHFVPPSPETEAKGEVRAQELTAWGKEQGLVPDHDCGDA